jgi:hypothetical protein
VPDVGLVLGAFRARVTTADRAVVEAMRRRWGPFLVEGPSEWSLRIEVDPEGGLGGEGVVVARDGAPDRFDLSRYDFRGTVDLGRRVVDVTIVEADELTLDSLLRVALTLVLLPARGLLVHAASLARDGRGYLFPGVSGAGKTTLARLTPDATLLSDELSIVTIGSDGPALYGTPFWGELARAGEAATAPLVGIYFPRQASHHALMPIAERAAISRLLPTVMTFAREPDVVARVFDLAADLVGRVPCFVLDFRRDPDFWEAIERG